jgi:hypothetical protein
MSDWQPDLSSLTGFTNWYNTHQASLTAAQRAKYDPYLKQLQGVIGYNASTGSWDASKWPTYNPVSWEGSQYQQDYNTYKGGMQGLLDRIGQGPGSTQDADIQAQVAGGYGMSGASWSALQDSIPSLLNASNAMARAGDIATGMQDSPFGQQQQQAMRVAERQATEQVGKQLEAIFGERGGLAGFQAAYDMTGQIQSAFMQQAAQNSLAMFDRAIQAVNAENGYYQDLVKQGAIQASDYLKFRWDALQTGYQDYAVAMDQAMQNWATQESVNEQQYQAAASVLQKQIDAITGALAAEMGIDTTIMNNMATQYDIYQSQAINQQAVTDEGNKASSQLGSAADTMMPDFNQWYDFIPPVAVFRVVTAGIMRVGSWLLDALGL